MDETSVLEASTEVLIWLETSDDMISVTDEASEAEASVKVSRLELDTKVEDGMRVSLCEVEDTKDAMLEAIEEDSKTDVLSTLADEAADDDTKVEEATKEMLNDTIVDDSGVCEDAKDEDESTTVELATELDTNELSSVDEARLETIVEDGMLLLGTTEVDTSEDATLEEAREAVWLSVLELGRTDDWRLEATVDETNGDVWDSTMLEEAIEEMTDDDSTTLLEARVVKATTELLTELSLIMMLDEIPDDMLSETDADVELTILLAMLEVGTTLEDGRRVADWTEDDEMAELNSEDMTLAKLEDGRMDETMLLDMTDDERTTDDVSD